ncbi:TRIO and F-actin-binding protein-like [Lampris incognitus]|uniref:TRIO and F-actin-binding protein-like n=1 Tax=Lampris incognitus TaxID=2546036 RepID=UPI0024B571FF|nr:TRIO and F-actin-binding protein-like [Lampris incognitus]
MDSEVNRKWTQFERLCFREMNVQSLIGAETSELSSQGAPQSLMSSQTCQSSLKDVSPGVTGCRANKQNSKEALLSVNGTQAIQSNTAEALQREALSLKQQVESIKRERLAMGMDVDSPCGPMAPCRARLEAMEAAHWKALQELQEKHAQEIRELESEKDRLLKEESQAAAEAMEALTAAHRKEMESEVEKARRLAGGGAHSDTMYREQMPPADPLCSELDALSARLSQKCLEVSMSEQNVKGRETELGRMEREMAQLRRENKDLKAKLAEEISRMRYFITGQRSEMKSLRNTSRSPSELEMLLRVKENEVEYLKKENGCLQSEVEFLKKEKAAAYERYQEAYVEFNAWKGRSQLEIGSLREHLKLANAALKEGAGDT